MRFERHFCQQQKLSVPVLSKFSRPVALNIPIFFVYLTMAVPAVLAAFAYN